MILHPKLRNDANASTFTALVLYARVSRNLLGWPFRPPRLYGPPSCLVPLGSFSIVRFRLTNSKPLQKAHMKAGLPQAIFPKQGSDDIVNRFLTAPS